MSVADDRAAIRLGSVGRRMRGVPFSFGGWEAGGLNGCFYVGKHPRFSTASAPMAVRTGWRHCAVNHHRDCCRIWPQEPERYKGGRESGDDFLKHNIERHNIE